MPASEDKAKRLLQKCKLIQFFEKPFVNVNQIFLKCSYQVSALFGILTKGTEEKVLCVNYNFCAIQNCKELKTGNLKSKDYANYGTVIKQSFIIT